MGSNQEVGDTGKFFGAAGLLAIIILQSIPFIASVIGCKLFDVAGVCFALMIVAYLESYLIDYEKSILRKNTRAKTIRKGQEIIMNGYVAAVILLICWSGLFFCYSQENNQISSSYQRAVSEMSQGHDKILISRKDMKREKYQEVYRIALENNYRITQISDNEAILEKSTKSQSEK